MKKNNKSKTVHPTIRPIDASLHNVVGGTAMSDMLAGAIAGGASGAGGGEVIPLKPFPDTIPLKPFPR